MADSTNRMNAKDQAILDRLEAEGYAPCKRGLAFLKRFDSLAEAWDACPVGGWLLWANMVIEDAPYIFADWSTGHTCGDLVRHPSRKCKRCREWADEIHANYKCPVPRRRKKAVAK